MARLAEAWERGPGTVMPESPARRGDGLIALHWMLPPFLRDVKPPSELQFNN